MLTVCDIFAGAGGSSSGAASVPGVEVKIAANHWQLAVDVHAENHQETEHACVDLHLEDPRNFPRTDILWASPECFTAGHLVTTRRGQVPIELVEVGDVVLTHKSRWREVVRVQASESKDVVVVKGQGHPGITTTASHRFWAKPSDLAWRNDIRQYRRNYGQPDWVQARDLANSKALWSTPIRVDAESAPDLPPVFVDSDHGWWLLGRWLGDGSLSFGRNHEVTITCGFHEAAELGALLAGTGVRWHRSDKRTAAVFTASCVESRDWLLEHCGHGSASKQTPAWTLMLGEVERRAILHGYMSADGYVSELHHRASTVSRALAITIRLLAESLGHRVSMAYDKRTTYSIEGRTGFAKRQWIMMWPRQISDKRTPEAHADINHAWSRVRSVTPVPGVHTVYNIEVAEDHSYVLDGIVVKNCTKWSIANSQARALSVEMGGDPSLFDDVPDELISEGEDEISRSRLLMFDVLRFVEHHRYRAVVVENVVDIATQAKYAAAWTAWQRGLSRLGYAYRVVSLNSMHAQAHGLPAPQSRDRLYIVAWPEGEKAPDIDRVLRPLAFCERCGKVVEAHQGWKPGRTVGRYRAQYVYQCSCGTIVEPGWLPASTAIDWSLRGQLIGERTKPLSPKTMARIREGLRRYGHEFVIEAAGNTYESGSYKRAWPVSEPLRTLHTTASKGLVLDAVLSSPIITTTDEPFRTQTTAYTRSLLVPVEGRDGKHAAPDGQPLRTQTARNELGVLTTLRGTNAPKLTDDVMDTIVASGNHHALLVPYYSASETAKPASRPVGTLTCVDRYALVMRNNTGGAEMSTPVREPLRTVTTAGHQSLLEPSTIEPEDCTFRMLEPHEIAMGMSFPADYRWQGTKRERVRLAGNAVTPPAARDLIAAVAESLGGVA